MKLLWDNMTNTMVEFNALIAELSAEQINDPRIKKAVKKLLDTWTKIINQRNELDKHIEPLPAISIKLPFGGAEFAEMWKTYKEYLQEDYAICIGSRRESIMLNSIKKMSDNNEKRATDMLELFIANGYKSMFRPSDKQLKGEEPAKNEEQTAFNMTKKATV
jgi:hypothetical protein